MYQTVSRGLFLLICLAFFAATAQAAQYAALVMDARTGKVLHSRHADTRVHPASLTKMMTLYIVFDEVQKGRLSLNQKVRISSNASAEPPSKLGLRTGQTIELRYLIRAAAVKSANDAATALGEAVAGSEAEFIKRMNAYAKAMGMTNTSFRNAHGLTATGHMSTARDMANLGRRLFYDFPQYYNLFSRQSTSAGIKTVRNTNRRLLSDYPGADGIKTGYTRAAGFNLVSSAKRGDKRVIVAVMGGRSSATRNAEVARLMDLGFDRMPRTARVIPPAPLRSPTTVVAAASQTPIAVAALTMRPMPRSMGVANTVARNNAGIAAAIAEVNAELAASKEQAGLLNFARLMGRPAPRPAAMGGTPPAPDAGSASTFASGAASTAIIDDTPPQRPEQIKRTVQLAMGTTSNTSTGGNDWGVQLGAFRAKGDAERQLLTTALKDVPHLSGGLRRIETANLDGVRVFRAQFVGLSQAAAVSACEELARLSSDCVPIAPGT
ncbi:serine hydrolase [Amaricoccus tamworthensis]|uniref:serine hydrolase n=1 Tax=Amaricoccus tamworthensis TaxID=57002 RepID=UPI003C7BD4A3